MKARHLALIGALAAFLPGTVLAQAYQGPATMVYPTTPGDCVEIASQGGGYLADAGSACGGGSGGTPGGSNKSVQINNSGAFGGIGPVNSAVLSTDGSGNVQESTTLPGSLTIPSPTLSGTVGGTGTIPNSVLANSSMTLAGHSVALGGTQAFACADLSNGATGCSTAVGTSGATLGLLNGTNTVSGVQTYGAGDFVLTGAVNGDIGTFNSSHALQDSGTLLSSLAPLASPGLTGVPTAPTAAVNTNTTQLATTAFVIGQGYGTGNCSASGSAGILSNNGSSACTTDTNATLSAGALSLGASGTPGSIIMGNATSGTLTLEAVTGALSSAVAFFPNNNGTVAETNLTNSFTVSQTFAGIQNSNNNGYGLGTGSCATANTTVCIEPDRNTATAGIGTHGVSGDVNVVTGAGTENMYWTTGGTFLATVTTGTNADTVCMATGGLLQIQAGACTISSMRFKTDISPFEGDALAELLALPVNNFRYKEKNKDPNGNALQVGLIAEDVASLMPECAMYENDMRTPKSYRQECVIAMLVRGMQEQQREIAEIHGVDIQSGRWMDAHAEIPVNSIQ
jgi:Chaperone of endosialidase